MVSAHPRPHGTWTALLEGELRLTEAFQELRRQDPWIWANNCWHPLETPLHRKHIGFAADDQDPFVAKLLLLEAALASA